MGNRKRVHCKGHGSAYEQALSRRAFLDRASRLGAGLLAAPYVLSLSGCGEENVDMVANERDGAAGTGGSSGGRDASSDASSPVDALTPNANAIATGAVLLGLYEGDGEAAARAAIDKLDFSWLREGDSVLIKVASNSGHVHPAVTSPAGVQGMVAHLKELGAGRVVVADQAGVEWVRRSAAGRFSSTRERFTENGLIALEAMTELHFFDDNGFEDGYFEATLPEGHHWPRGMYLPNVIREIDHVIYMPRLSQHILAGVTLAQKSAIGFIRDDSRHDLHNDAVDFYEKYTEINYTEELKSRTRLVMSVNEKLHLHGGPDVATVYEMTPTLVLASASLTSHDSLGASLLVTLGAMVPAGSGGMTYNGGFASFANTAFAGGFGVGMGEAGAWISGSPSSSYVAHAFAEGITKDRALQRGWALSGGQPERIEVVQDGATLEANVREGVETHGEGLYAFG